MKSEASISSISSSIAGKAGASKHVSTISQQTFTSDANEREYVGAAGPPLLKTCRLRPHCAPSIHHTGGRQPSQRRPLLCGKIRYNHPKPALTCSLFPKKTKNKNPSTGYLMQTSRSLFPADIVYFVHFLGFKLQHIPMFN